MALLKPLTLKVNDVVSGAQLQKFVILKAPDGNSVLAFYFYPGAHWLLISGHSELRRELLDKEAFKEFRKGYLSQSKLPMALYMKAHFINQRIDRIELQSTSLFRFHFLNGDHLEFLMKSSRLELSFHQQNRDKAFKKSMVLSDVNWGVEVDDEVPKEPASKRKRLIKNVKGDLKQAELWLAENSKYLDVLKDQGFVELQTLVNRLFDESPITSLANIKKVKWITHFQAALDDLVKKNKKMNRKLLTAQKRLDEVLNNENEGLKKQGSNSVKSTSSSKETKTIGLLVLGWTQQNKYLLGRNSRENHKLYQSAKSNDLWFHVKGYAGGHVWMKKKTKEINVHDKDFLFAAQLALWNSKLKTSKSGEVQFTEKRYLKSVKSQAGLLRVLRSTMVWVTLSEEFIKHMENKKW